MVRTILHLSGNPQSDAADALACAICHGFTYAVTKAMGKFVADGGFQEADCVENSIITGDTNDRKFAR